MLSPKNKNIKSGMLLALGFGLLIFAFIIFTFYFYQKFAQSNKDLTDETNRNDTQLNLTMSMRVAVRERAILLWQMTLLKDPFDRDELFDKFYEYGSNYKSSRIQYTETKLNTDEIVLLELLDHETSQRAHVLRTFANDLMEGKNNHKYEEILNRVISEQIVVADILDDLISLQQEENNVARQKSAQSITILLTNLIITISIIILLGIIFARIVIKNSNCKTELLEAANKDLDELAKKDHLTGLPNRMYLIDHLNLQLSLSKRNNSQGALLFIDLDEFKPINDNFGHEAGDEYLKLIANEMSNLLRDSDVLARLGGDEFVVALFDIQDESQVMNVTNKLLDKLSSDYIISGNTIRASASIGICYFPQKDMTVDMLISRADAAMYQAKNTGKNKYYVSQ